MPLIAEHDLRKRSASCQEEEIEALFERDGRIHFDLANGPALRVSLITLAADRHMLLISAPSLCADSTSLRIMVREIGRLCSSWGQEPSGEPSQYADLAEWQNDLLESGHTQGGIKNWRDAGVSAFRAPILSFEKPPSARTAFEPRVVASTIEPQLAMKIRKLATEYDTSPSVFFMACWQILLWRLTGESDFAIGLACDGRTYEALQEALGLFAKMLPIRCQIDGRSPFNDVLKRADESAREAVEWQEYFDIEQLPPPEGEIKRSPLFPITFELRDEATSHTGSDATFLVRKEYCCFEQFALKLLCIRKGDQLALELQYDSGTFRTEDVCRLAQEFRTLLESSCANPESRIAELEYVSPVERRQLLVEFNDTRTERTEGYCIHELFAQRVRRAPENIAVTFGNQRLTYAQLDARANQLARHLQTLGVGPDVPVAICMERSLEMIIGLLGTLKAGGAYVPLDPAYPLERIRYLLRDVKASVLLTQYSLVDRMPELGVNTVCVDSEWETIATHDEHNPCVDLAPANLAYVIYTSGSTGQPKGVMVEHGGLTNAIDWITKTLALSSSDRCLLKTPITFDAAGRELFPILLAGGTLVIAEYGGHRDSRYLAETIRHEQISILHCVPSMLQLLAEEPALGESPALRAVMCGGEALAPEIVTRFLGRFKASLYNVYGPTEAIIDSTFWRCDKLDTHSTIPIGRPIPNVQTYILDDQLNLLPIGATGNLYIGGNGLARGYAARADLTAEKFIPDPFTREPGCRLYKTGDRARYLSDGRIEYLDRIDYQVKLRGFRIELGEIEKTLRKHPAVRDAVVLVQESGAGEKRLEAYVVSAEETRPTAVELRDFVKSTLPDHMIPAVFVLLDALPLSANGKVDRCALPKLDARRPELDERFVASRTPTEELLSQIWSQVLGVEQIGIHDDFFQLGGHSLLATQVVSRIREAFHIEMPLRRLFEAPTVAAMAASIDAGGEMQLEASPIVPVSRNRDLPLSFAQQRLWFIDQLDPGSSVYNFPVAVHLSGPLNVPALKQSLNEIVKRHEALRTTVATVDGRPVQIIAPLLRLVLPIVDLRELPEPQREIEVQRLATNEALRPFDLAEGPLVRATVLWLSDNEHVGLLTMHHIVCDGWSTGILIREMASLYEAFCSGKPVLLPDLPIQYADFAHWQRGWLEGEVLETQLAYWKRQLGGAPPLLDLPTDHPRPTVQTFRGAHQSLRLSQNLIAGLKTLSRQHGVTLFMTLLAAFKILLHCYTSQDDISIGTPIANRNRLELEGLIGFFVNTLVVRTDLSGDPDFPELLRRVREVCLGAYAHQDLPFERLVEELHLERNLSRNPLFQVMFVLQNNRLEKLELQGLTLNPFQVDSETTHFDLTLHIADAGTELIATVAYNTDLFDASTIAGMLQRLEIVLQAICTSPDRHLSELQLLTQAERQLLVEWNGSSTAQPHSLCVHQLFEAQAERTPDAIAVCFEAKELTYEQLNGRANQLARHLRMQGVGPEVPVGIYIGHSLDAIVGLLGVLKAGGVYTPMDPAYPKNRIALMIDNAEVAVLLTETGLRVGLPERDTKVICLDSDWSTIAQESAENPICLTKPENLAYLIFTSGSTGEPKGVLVSHSSTAEHCLNIQRHYELTSNDKVLQFASLSFDVSLEQILPTLLAGATLNIIRTDAWDITEFHQRIAQAELTVLNLPTSYWNELARTWADLAELTPRIQPRLFVVGGDTMLPEFLDLWQRSPLSAVRLLNAYGPTETTITATVFDTCAESHVHSKRHRVPIGRPLHNREIHILNKYGNAVPVGIHGELYIGGAGVARGYLKRPDLTVERFIPNPFSSDAGARLYKTGDMARYLPDGNIEFLGRLDHQVKIRGFRIELGEIETVLRQHPAVREAIVAAREDGSGEQHLVAYVVAQGNPLVSNTELRGFLKEKLPDYMVPAIFEALDKLPLMPNGKVDRGALPEPRRTRSEGRNGFVAPRNALELQLSNLWEEVLGIRPVGVKDNFFELGGHSLAAVRLFALIEKRLGKKVPLAILFQGATVEHLASILRQHTKETAPACLVPIQPNGKRSPLFLIHPAGGHVFPYVHLANSLGPDQPCYGLQAKGLEEGQEPQTRIEEMAAFYIDAMRSVQAEGPYFLGGWSMGGVVAFEMAQQLRAQGQRTALLALLDTRIPDADEEFADAEFEVTLLVDFVRYFGLSLDPRDALARLPKNELLERVLEYAKRAGLMPSDVEVSQAQPFIDLCKADFRATQKYVLRPYPGRITLFKAGQELAGTSSDPTFGWSEWAGGGVDIHVVPGNHATMVYKPYVAVLAEQLRACLDQVRAAEEWTAEITNT
jgi:amino acid adenylation domain-containing protein